MSEAPVPAVKPAVTAWSLGTNGHCYTVLCPSSVTGGTSTLLPCKAQTPKPHRAFRAWPGCVTCSW